MITTRAFLFLFLLNVVLRACFVLLEANAEDNIGPLDDWNITDDNLLAPKPSPEPAVRPSPGPGEAESGDLTSQDAASDSVDSQSDKSGEESGKEEGLLGPKKIKISKRDRLRLEKARAQRRSVLREQREWVKRATRRDPRGEPEIRLCSLNLNRYGLPAAYRKLFKKESLSRLIKRERSAVAAAKEARCDIIAVQGVVGPSYVSMKGAVERFAAKLGDETGKQWKSFLGGSNVKNAANAFMLSDSGIRIVGIRSYEEQNLPVLKDAVPAVFSRAPFELELLIDGRGDAEQKRLVLISLSFRGKATTRKLAPVGELVRVGEEVRRIVERKLKDDIASEPPLIAVLGERLTGEKIGVSDVLEGKLRLADFQREDGCVIKDARKLSCPKGVLNPKVLLGLFSSALPPRGTLAKEEKQGQVHYRYIEPDKAMLAEWRKARDSRNAEIYLVQSAIPYAVKDPSKPLVYATGEQRVLNSLRNSPLLWVELNW